MSYFSLLLSGFLQRANPGFFRPFLLAITTTTITALATGMPAHAQQQQIEEIIVTSTKRETAVQDVPFSINVQTQQDIQRSGASNLEELSRNIAGLTVQNLGPGQSQVAIRGVSAGQIVRDQPGVKEQVGVYLDESVISLSLFTPDLDLYGLAPPMAEALPNLPCLDCLLQFELLGPIQGQLLGICLLVSRRHLFPSAQSVSSRPVSSRPVSSRPVVAASVVAACACRSLSARLPASCWTS